MIGVEKNNDDCRKIHIHKSIKWDAAKYILLVSKRIETLYSFERTPRTYTKRNADYWKNEIKENRKKLRQCPDSQTQESENCIGDPVRTVTANEIKEALKGFGYKTRVRNLNRLQELYRDAVNDI